jgi:hypothetical protein
MDARHLRAALLVAAVLSLGAGRPYHSVRSQHFIVSAPTSELAKEICQAAETYRRDLAIEWLGHELPEWQSPCPIRADVAPQLGAGGATSFVFQGRVPTQWTMQIQGSRERILDSVLPHEVTHTIFATHFGGPLPRWADEGACTTVEHPSEKAKQDKFLIQFLTPDGRGNTRGIPFNKMFAMKQYPQDILPLYSQGYSLARYLIEQGGKRKFVQYVGEGMRTNNWTASTRSFYGFESLSELQVTWLQWVGKGSPKLTDPSALASDSAQPRPATQMASLTQQPRSRVVDGPPSSWQTTHAQNARALARASQSDTPPAPTHFSSESPPIVSSESGGGYSSVSRPVSEGWYAKRRDQAQAILRSPAGDPAAPSSAPPSVQSPISQPPLQSPSGGGTVPPPPTRRAAAHIEPLTPVAYHAPAETNAATAHRGNRKVLLEWKRAADQP